MGVNRQALAKIVARYGKRGQSKAAAALDIPKSTLSRVLGSEDEARAVQWRTVLRMARAIGAPFQELWAGPIPPQASAELNVSRETSHAVRGPSATWGDPQPLHPDQVEGALWAIEQMNLAIADIARRARQHLVRQPKEV